MPDIATPDNVKHVTSDAFNLVIQEALRLLRRESHSSLGSSVGLAHGVRSYLVVSSMRFLILLAILVWYSIFASPDNWWLAAVISSFAIYTLVIAILDARRLNEPYVDPFPLTRMSFQALADTFHFSSIIVFAGDLQSDFYLFYLLPILIISKFSDDTLPIFLIVILSFMASAMIALQNHDRIIAIFNETIFRDASVYMALLTALIPKLTFLIVAMFFMRVMFYRLEKRRRELHAVHETSDRMARHRDMQSILEIILDTATALLGTRGCKVYRRIDGGRLELAAIRGLSPEGESILRVGHIIEPGQEVAGKVLAEKRSMIVGDYANSRYAIEEFRYLFGTVLEAPLIFSDDVIGVIGVFDDAKNRSFDREDQDLLGRLAKNVAVAIAKSAFYDEIQEQRRAREVLKEGSERVNSSLEVEDTLAPILEIFEKISLAHGVTPEFIGLWVLDRNRNDLVLHGVRPDCYGRHSKIQASWVNLANPSSGVVGRAVNVEETQVVPDLESDPDYVFCNVDAKSMVAVPLKGEQGIFGVVDIEHSRPNGFSEKVIHSFETFARDAAVAIERAAHHHHLNMLHEASIEISSAQGLDMVAESILSELRKIVPYDRAALQRIDGDERQILYVDGDAHAITDLEKTLSGDALVHGIICRDEICILSPPRDCPDWERNDSAAEIQTWIGIPLVCTNEPVGFIAVDQLTTVEYNRSLVWPLNIFAKHAASSLKNALLDEQKEQKIRELDEARAYHEALNEHLADQSNLALIGLVYGETIHHARNKLGAASTYAAHLSKGWYSQDQEKLKERASRIQSNISDYLDALNEIQKSAIEAPKIVASDLHKIIERVLGMVRISRSIVIQRELNSPDAVVRAPERQVQQVIRVIVHNALEAMGRASGALTIGSRIVEHRGKKFLEVAISDTGEGIPKEKMHMLFKRKDKGGRKGTGMGLMWAYSFLKSYGGFIECESKVGEGTTMRIFLPRDFRDTQQLTLAADEGVDNVDDNFP